MVVSKILSFRLSFLCWDKEGSKTNLRFLSSFESFITVAQPAAGPSGAHDDMVDSGSSGSESDSDSDDDAY